jgi:hypothetical protein
MYAPTDALTLGAGAAVRARLFFVAILFPAFRVRFFRP